MTKHINYTNFGIHCSKFHKLLNRWIKSLFSDPDSKVRIKCDLFIPLFPTPSSKSGVSNVVLSRCCSGLSETCITGFCYCSLYSFLTHEQYLHLSLINYLSQCIVDYLTTVFTRPGYEGNFLLKTHPNGYYDTEMYL